MEGQADEPTVIILVDEVGGVNAPEFRTSTASETTLISPDLSAHELWIARFLNRLKLENEPHLLHVHSAAVARGDAAVLLVGRSGVGKSTLTAGLVSRGWDYATDEQVTISPDSGRLIPYPRPITLRRAVWPLFTDVGEVRAALAGPAVGQRIEIAPATLGSVSDFEKLTPMMIVAPNHDATLETRIERLPSTAASVELLATSCFDMDRLGPAGLEALIALACRCCGWRLTYSDLDEASELLTGAFVEAIRAPEVSVRELSGVSKETKAPPGFLVRSHDARCWAFGDGSSVVVDPTGRRLVQLDSYGVALWELLEVPHSLDDLVSLASDEDARLGLRGWIDTLAGSGFIVLSSGLT